MAAIVDVANIALISLGEQKIANLDDQNERARVMNTRIDNVRRAVLQAHPWNFAEQVATLAELTGAPAWGFGVRYQLPADCLMVRAMESENSIFRIFGRELHTDESTANILYTRDAVDPNEWSPLFIEAFGARLAHETSETLTKNNKLKEDMWRFYISKMAEASFVDSQEGTTEQNQENPFLAVRG